MEGIEVEFLSSLFHSTIGPITATLSGILTVDCGSPQFSMHSIRYGFALLCSNTLSEMMGVEDIHTGFQHLKSAFLHHAEVAQRMESIV